MDARIRELERRYQNSELPEDIILWANATLRAGLLSEIEERINIRSGEEELLSIPALAEKLLIFNITACVLDPWQIRNLTNEQLQRAVGPPSLRLFIYTITRIPQDCPCCGRSGPHSCMMYNQNVVNLYADHQEGHPYRSGTLLPLNPDWYGLSEELPEELHPEIYRQWSPDRPRKMKQEYRYLVHKWSVQPFPSQSANYLPSGWYIHLVGDAQLRNSFALHKRVAGRNTGEFRNLIEMTDIIDSQSSIGKIIYQPGNNCFTIFNKTVFPIPIDHELPQHVPYIVIGPCNNFGIIPKGDKIYLPELDQYVPSGITVTVFESSGIPGITTTHAVAAYDTSTECGHGHIKGFPLCPPRWSDTGEIAAIHCEACARLLPLVHKTPTFLIRTSSGELVEKSNPFHICDDCSERNSRDVSFLTEFMQEPGEGLWYFCQNCEDNGDDGYYIENHCYCVELATKEGDLPPILEKRYRCPFCVFSDSYSPDRYVWYKTPKEAIDCCTKIKLWDFNSVAQAYDL